MVKISASVEVIALETLTAGGISHKPGTPLEFPKDEAQRLVDGRAAAWPNLGAAPASRRPADIDLLAAIGQAMRSIDPMEGVTPEGKVSLYALRHHLGFEVSAAERDAAQEAFEDKRALFNGGALKHDFGDPLLNAIHALAPGAPANWTQDGRPSAPALAEALNRGVSAAERDEAWAAYQKARAALAETK